MIDSACNPPADGHELVDFWRAARRLGVDMDDYLAVVDVFLEDAGRARAKLAAAGSADPWQLVAISHELANSFGVVGASRAERLARAVEHGLSAGESLDVVASAAMLMRELDGVQRLVRSFAANARAHAHDAARCGIGG